MNLISMNKLWQLLLSRVFVLFLSQATYKQVYGLTQASVSSRTFYGLFQQPAEEAQALQV